MPNPGLPGGGNVVLLVNVLVPADLPGKSSRSIGLSADSSSGFFPSG